MEKEIILKPKKKSKLKRLFEDKNKRYLYVFLFILPFLIAICIFGYMTFNGVKEIIDLAKGETVVKDEYNIKSMGYTLRKNATDIEFAYFSELKNAIEIDNADDATIAGLVCKNYVADFYTWTNKQGQYDISALYYVYTPQKEDIYLNARDGFYKYLNTYIDKYGANNLLEVDYVDVSNAKVANYEYISANNEKFDNCYDVTCNWTYKQNDIFDTSNYVKTMYFLVVKREGRFEIVEASENPVDARQIDTNGEENE